MVKDIKDIFAIWYILKHAFKMSDLCFVQAINPQVTNDTTYPNSTKHSPLVHR